MRRYALAVVFGALHVCQAFRTKTSRAWEGAVVKPVTFQSPETPLQAECSGTMPSFDSDDQEVMDFFQGLSIGDRRPLWRTAKFYNQMTKLTL